MLALWQVILRSLSRPVDLNPPATVYYLPLVVFAPWFRQFARQLRTSMPCLHVRHVFSAQPLLDSPVPPGMIVIAVVVAAPTHWLCYVLAFSLNRLHHIDVRFDSLGRQLGCCSGD